MASAPDHVLVRPNLVRTCIEEMEMILRSPLLSCCRNGVVAVVATAGEANLGWRRYEWELEVACVRPWMLSLPQLDPLLRAARS